MRLSEVSKWNRTGEWASMQSKNMWRSWGTTCHVSWNTQPVHSFASSRVHRGSYLCVQLHCSFFSDQFFGSHLHRVLSRAVDQRSTSVQSKYCLTEYQYQHSSAVRPIDLFFPSFWFFFYHKIQYSSLGGIHYIQ